MTVIDLRDELYKRNIDIIEITDECVYYAEELKINGVDTIHIYCYSFLTENEEIMSYFTFDDTTYLQHYYAGKNSIIVLFENNENKVWIVKIDKRTNNEVLRKKIPLIGRFSDCVAVDDNNIIIYSKSDEENRALFNRCLEETNCDCLANLYDLENGIRYFVRDFKTIMLVKNHLSKFIGKNGREYLLLGDPYCESEEEKESLFRELGTMAEDIRDNIWKISKKRFLEEVRDNSENFKLKKVASAGIGGAVRFECVSQNQIIFRAKSFSSEEEHFFKISVDSGKVRPLCSVREKNEHARYFTDLSVGKIYYMEIGENDVTIKGEINSTAEITYPNSIGKIVSCIDDRFIIADNSLDSGETIMSIYDGKLHLTDTYQARVKTKGNVIVFY